MTVLQLNAVSASIVRGAVTIHVLRDVSMEVEAAELFAIYGKRAAGKTTLLEIAAGLTTPASGSVLFNGVDLTTLSRGQLARLHREDIGWVERDGPQMVDMPMHVHVALPLYRTMTKTKARARALAVLERVGAADYADARWADLPDTARTFVAIAHALVREPQLLVVDDPLYGLGVTDREAVIGLLREVAEVAGIAVVLAVPEMPAMLHAHQARVLANGTLIGPPPDDGGTVVDLRDKRSA